MNETITGAAGHRIVVGVDGSNTALHAVDWAVHEAGRRGVGLHLVHAGPYLRGAADSQERRRARAVLARGYTVAHQAARDLPITTELVAGAPAKVLVGASKGAALLVLGMVGTGAADEILLGSVALDVSGRAHSPVVVVRGRRQPDPDKRPVLLGVGAEPGDDPVIGFAFDAAQRRGVKLLAVHALQRVMSRLAGDRTVRQVEHAPLSERLIGWQRRHPAVGVCPVVLHGRPTYCSPRPKAPSWSSSEPQPRCRGPGAARVDEPRPAAAQPVPGGRSAPRRRARTGDGGVPVR
jgi:nucleotide-binding universal stress UspA family protein